MRGKDFYLKEDIVWALETFIGLLKSSEAIHQQTIRVVERLKSLIVDIVPTHEVGSPWHTETPTEDGWYLCAYGDNFYCANYWQGGTWKNQWGGTLLAYQKIEPYEEAK